MTQINEVVEGRLWIVRNAVPKTLCDHTALEYRMIKDVVQYQHPDIPLGDPTVPGGFSMYSPICFEALGQYHKPLIEMLIKRKLWQAYSYGRMYVKGTECQVHRDRSSGEWVGNICVSADPQYHWPFFIEVEGKTYEFTLNTGDSIIFNGHKDLHWRPNYEGDTQQIQCVVSYVEQGGDYAKNKWDGRPMLAAPWEAAGEWIHKEQSELNYDSYYGPCENNTGKTNE